MFLNTVMFDVKFRGMNEYWTRYVDHLVSGMDSCLVFRGFWHFSTQLGTYTFLVGGDIASGRQVALATVQA